MLISNMKTYEHIKHTGNGKYIEYFSIVIWWYANIEDRSIKNSFNDNNFSIGTQHKNT